MAGTDGLARGRQRHVDALGDQSGGVALGAQHHDAVVIRLLCGGAGDVDALAGVGPVFLGQRAQRLTSQRDGRLVTEVLGLGAGQGVEVSGLVEGETGGVDRRGQCFFR